MKVRGHPNNVRVALGVDLDGLRRQQRGGKLGEVEESAAVGAQFRGERANGQASTDHEDLACGIDGQAAGRRAIDIIRVAEYRAARSGGFHDDHWRTLDGAARRNSARASAPTGDVDVLLGVDYGDSHLGNAMGGDAARTLGV